MAGLPRRPRQRPLRRRQDARRAGVPIGELLEALLVADRLRRGARGRAHDRGAGPDREPRAARRGRPRVRRAQRPTARARSTCFLQEIALVADADTRSDDEGLVTLMTLHNAKGLEYPIVFIAGCEDGVFPHSRAIDEGGLEEERRLFYVGITRAMRQLYLTYARRRAVFGAQTYGCAAASSTRSRPTCSRSRSRARLLRAGGRGARAPRGARGRRRQLGEPARGERSARRERGRLPARSASASARTSCTPPSATASSPASSPAA